MAHQPLHFTDLLDRCLCPVLQGVSRVGVLKFGQHGLLAGAPRAVHPGIHLGGQDNETTASPAVAWPEAAMPKPTHRRGSDPEPFGYTPQGDRLWVARTQHDHRLIDEREPMGPI